MDATTNPDTEAFIASIHALNRMGTEGDREGDNVLDVRPLQLCDRLGQVADGGNSFNKL